jgi:hypothetical protein
MNAVDSPGETAAARVDSPEPSAPSGVREGVGHRRAEQAPASSERASHEPSPTRRKIRRPKPWRVSVVRIDAQTYPQFQNDREHPFSALAREARVEEIDAFLARLLARSKKLGPPVGGRVNAAPLQAYAATETARPH